jgi:hypothetical protein
VSAPADAPRKSGVPTIVALSAAERRDSFAQVGSLQRTQSGLKGARVVRIFATAKLTLVTLTVPQDYLREASQLEVVACSPSELAAARLFVHSRPQGRHPDDGKMSLIIFEPSASDRKRGNRWPTPDIVQDPSALASVDVRCNEEPKMNLSELLPNGGIEALASQLGIPAEQAQRGAEALLPSVLGGMGDNAAGLDTHVNGLGGVELAQNVVGSEPTQINKGNQLLGGIFGSKDVSRQVAGHAAQNSGLDPAILKQMLPILAMLVAGHLAGRSGGQQGGLGGILGSVLGGLGGAGVGGGALGGGLGGGLGKMLGSILSGRR